MGRNKQPIELVIANGKKHLTKEEINFRRESEVKPITDNIEAPSYLTAKQKKEFNNIANKRKKEVQSDVDTLFKWSNLQDKFFKQCRTCASDLGLTISSRCKLVIPEIKKEAPKENKFKKFEKVTAG